jgi:hypothetical protein
MSVLIWRSLLVSAPVVGTPAMTPVTITLSVL